MGKLEDETTSTKALSETRKHKTNDLVKAKAKQIVYIHYIKGTPTDASKLDKALETNER